MKVTPSARFKCFSCDTFEWKTDLSKAVQHFHTRTQITACYHFPLYSCKCIALEWVHAENKYHSKVYNHSKCHTDRTGQMSTNSQITLIFISIPVKHLRKLANVLVRCTVNGTIWLIFAPCQSYWEACEHIGTSFSLVACDCCVNDTLECIIWKAFQDWIIRAKCYSCTKACQISANMEWDKKKRKRRSALFLRSRSVQIACFHLLSHSNSISIY